MKGFTYYDYLKCIHTLRLNSVFRLAEQGTKYQLTPDQKITSKQHDKLAKNILKEPKEMAKLINDFLEPNQKIESKNLLKYTNSYATNKFCYKEADLIYQLKNEELFFLVEHQSTIDYAMPYRILNYCIDIMYEWSKTKKVKKETRYPIIVPIVIYTGMEKWKIPKKINEKQTGNYVLENYKIDLEYNLIEIQKLSTKFLLQKRSLFGYGMILEKARNRQELKENLVLIVNHMKDVKQRKEIKNMVLYLLKDSMEEGMLEKIKSKVKKGEEENMSSLYERLVNEFRENIKKEKEEGRMEALREITKKLIKNHVSDQIIMESAQITKEELEEYKKELWKKSS